MKSLLLLTYLFLSTATYACADFSGSFRTAEGAVYSIGKMNCESMDMTDEARTITIRFNQVEQIIYDIDMTADDQVIGKHRVYITSKLKDDKWLYDERAVSTFIDGHTETRLSKSEVYLNEKRNLVTVVYRDGGVVEEYEDERF